MTEEMWERVCAFVSVRLKSGLEFYEAVKAGLKDCGIHNCSYTPAYYCSEIGRRLGNRKGIEEKLK